MFISPALSNRKVFTFDSFIDPASVWKDFSTSGSKETASACLGIVVLIQSAAQTNFCN
jgi:hypothetical protein